MLKKVRFGKERFKQGTNAKGDNMRSPNVFSASNSNMTIFIKHNSSVKMVRKRRENMQRLKSSSGEKFRIKIDERELGSDIRNR